MSTAIKLRRDTTANWTTNENVVLALGEVGVDTTLNQIKIGTGTTPWSTLPFTTPKLTNPDIGEGNYASASAMVTALGLKASSSDMTTALGLKANIASPTFTGVTSGIRVNVSTKTSSTTLDLSDDIVIPSGSATAITLPTAIGISGKKYIIKNGLISSFLELSLTCTGAGNTFTTSGTVDGLNLIAGDRIQVFGDANVYSITSASGVSINVYSSVSFAPGSQLYIYHITRTTSSQTIDWASPSALISSREKISIVSDGSNWLTV